MTIIKKKVSIVIGSYNRRKFMKLAINSIREEIERENLNSEIIVIDGGSDDGSIKWLMKQKDIITIVQHNRGTWRNKLIERRSWGYFMNLGFKIAQGEYICMLSDDCLVIPGAIAKGIEYVDARREAGDNVGACAFYWRNWPEDRSYRVGVAYGSKIYVNHGLYLNEAMRKAGYIDEDNFFFYHADSDLSLKIEQEGYTVIDCPDSFIEHFNHANVKVRASNVERQKQDWLNYNKKWSSIYSQGDKDDYGGGLYLDFDDKKKTADKFKKAIPVIDMKGQGVINTIKKQAKFILKKVIKTNL